MPPREIQNAIQSGGEHFKEADVKRPLLYLSLLLALCALLSQSALAETRRALVVGNDDYRAFTPLKNAKNDAQAIGDELKKLGFEVVLAQNATATEMETTLKTWTAGLKDADVALFFYAGHGLQVEGTNYLVPVDFDGDEIDAKHECLNADIVRERMEKSGADTNILVLDACRNNPFSSSRGGTRGLVFMEGGVGTLIAFATSPGGVANDNPDGSNGLFTKHLLANLATPGLDALQVFQAVGRGVYKESNGSQKPWISASVMPKNFYFVSAPPTAATFTEPTPLPTSSPTSTPTTGEPTSTVATANHNTGRMPKPNIVLLLVAENPDRTQWLLELTRDRIYKWYGGGQGSRDINLSVEFVAYSDKAGRSLAKSIYGLESKDLPAMVSARKINGKYVDSLAIHKRVKESTDLAPFFDTLFEPK